MPGVDQLFPQDNTPAPAVQALPGQGEPAAGAAAGLPGQAPGGPMGPEAQEVIKQFVAFAKQQGYELEEIVELIMSAITASGKQAPPEEQVRELVGKYFNEAEGAAPAPQGGVPANPAGGPPTGGGGLPQM